MSKGLEQTVSKEDTRVANNGVKTCSVSLAIMEAQTNLGEIAPTSVKVAVTRKRTPASVDKDAEKSERLHISGGNATCREHPAEWSGCSRAQPLHRVLLSGALGLQPARLLCPWDFPGKNTGVGCHALLQGTFPTQGSHPRLLCLLHHRRFLYC